ncbi:MAG: hypothetical protein RRB13_08695 [bacterium]|nr:hypothetical protein [bacterium]
MGNQFKQLLITALLVLGLAAPASADMMGVYADIPLSHSLNGTQSDGSTIESDGAPSGYMLGLTLPFFMGLGYEAYNTGIKDDLISDIQLETKMYNLFLDIPFPMLNLVVGVGAGKHNITCTGCEGAFNEGNASQTFVNLGWPVVLGLFDVHLGYHMVKGKIAYSADTSQEIDTQGTVTSLGVKFGF